MKTLGMLIAGIFSVHTVLVAQQNEVRVQSNPVTGNESYSSFYFLEETANKTGTSFHQDYRGTNQGMDLEIKNKKKKHKDGTMSQHHKSGMAFGKHDDIKNAILHEMVSRGYEVDAENPDLLVSYQVIEEDATISGFSDDAATNVGPGTQLPETVEVGAGTIVISVTDRESGQMISRGFISEALSFDMSDQDLSMEEGMRDDKDRTDAGFDKDKDHAWKYRKKAEVIQAVARIFDRLQIGESATLGAGR